MQNWEVLQKKISEMKKDEFIGFMGNNATIQQMRNVLGIEFWDCSRTDCSGRKCKECVKDILNREYQPPKQEKWIVHRTLKTNGMETYVSYLEIDRAYFNNKWNTRIIPDYTYNKNYAKSFNKHQAIKVRDELNKDRVGKQYLWVISKVE